MGTELELDPNEKMYWLFENYGRATIHNNSTLPQRYDILKYDHASKNQELDNNIKWMG